MTTVNFDFLLQPTIDPLMDFDFFGTTESLDGLFGVTEPTFDFPNFDTTTDSSLDFSLLTTISPDIFGITEPLLLFPTTAAGGDLFWPTVSTAPIVTSQSDAKKDKKSKQVNFFGIAVPVRGSNLEMKAAIIFALFGGAYAAKVLT